MTLSEDGNGEDEIFSQLDGLDNEVYHNYLLLGNYKWGAKKSNSTRERS